MKTELLCFRFGSLPLRFEPLTSHSSHSNPLIPLSAASHAYELALLVDTLQPITPLQT